MPTLKGFSGTFDKVKTDFSYLADGADSAVSIVAGENSTISFFEKYMDKSVTNEELKEEFNKSANEIKKFGIVDGVQAMVNALLGDGAGNTLAAWLNGLLFPPASGTPEHMEGWKSAANFFIDKLQFIEGALNGMSDKVGATIGSVKDDLTYLGDKLDENKINISEIKNNVDSVDTTTIPHTVASLVSNETVKGVLEVFIEKEGDQFKRPTPQRVAGTAKGVVSLEGVVKDLADLIVPYDKDGKKLTETKSPMTILNQTIGFDLSTI